MKKLLFIALSIIATSCFTPKFVVFDENEFVKVYENLNDSQDDLFLKANEWMVSIFKDAKSVVQHSDKEEGAIIGKYLMHYIQGSTGAYSMYPPVEVYAKIDIRIRDGKARLAIVPYDYSYNQMFPYTKENALDDMNDLAASFEQKIKTKKIDF